MSDISLLNQIKNYDKPHCYQYQKRLDTLEEDKKLYNLTDGDIANIKLSDFEFKNVTSKEDKQKCVEFIKKYEWLGSISQFPTHWFIAVYKDILCGVIIMNMPNAFSKMLGEGTDKVERLISRGASISFAVPNLASSFLMWCMKWMVKNTHYRLFTCYSDPQAKEVGTIYQSLGFFYLGQKSGACIRCISPYNPNKIVSDRTFRTISFYKKYAKDLGIEWESNGKKWNNGQSMLWKNMPDGVEKKLRDYSKEMYAKSEKIKFPPKHKYAYVLGANKKETKELREKFLSLNKVYPYPKERGK